MRKAVTLLQAVCQVSAASGRCSDRDEVFELAGMVPPDVLAGFERACRSGSVAEVVRAVDAVVGRGYLVPVVVRQAHESLVASVPEARLEELLRCTSEVEADLGSGTGNERLQLLKYGLCLRGIGLVPAAS